MICAPKPCYRQLLTSTRSEVHEVTRKQRLKNICEPCTVMLDALPALTTKATLGNIWVKYQLQKTAQAKTSLEKAKILLPN